ncbi:hypothetical protein SETIT_1G278700v2 [Setaria italica]|uniref:Alpha-1,3/1,6-mannosyltransferase ALG2 n=1 Tax=Setaria italica TaxID=4555 RepID=K3YYE8_SETIT|nr:hypothetical protein SETIT_1G278700v2 [Setaria italica]
MVDVACQLTAHGHNVQLFTSHHDKTRCFEENVSDKLMHRYYLSASFQSVFCCHFPDLLLALHTYSSKLQKLYRKPIGKLGLILSCATVFQSCDACMADLIPVNSKLNFLPINCFERKKKLVLTISAFALINSVVSMPSSGHDKHQKENVEYLEPRRLAVTEGVSDHFTFDEHFGIVPLEAMAAKKPVIACNSGGPVETIANELTGFICEPSPIELLKAISTLSTELYGAEFSTRKFGDLLNCYVLNVYNQRTE